MRKCSWNHPQLVLAANNSTSIRQVLIKLHLREAGGTIPKLNEL